MTVLNHLSLIKDRIVRYQALSAAQMASLRAYRELPSAPLGCVPVAVSDPSVAAARRP